MKRRALAVLAAVAVLAAGCGGDPSTEAEPDPVPGAEPPAGFAAHTVGPISLAVPDDWVQTAAPPAATAVALDELSLQAPAPDGQPTAVVVAVVAAEPSRSAQEELEALVRIKRDVHRVEVRTTALALDGFASATLAAYEDESAPGPPQRTEVLIGALPDGGVLSLTVKAPVMMFEDLDLSAVARSTTAATAAS